MGNHNSCLDIYSIYDPQNCQKIQLRQIDLKIGKTYQCLLICCIHIILMIQDKDRLVQEFRTILDIDNYDHNEINEKLAEIIKDVRKLHPAGRDD